MKKVSSLDKVLFSESSFLIDQQGEICLTLENFIRNCLLQSVDNSNVYFQEPTGHQDHESVVGTTEFPSNDEEDVVQLQGSLVSFVRRVNLSFILLLSTKNLRFL